MVTDAQVRRLMKFIQTEDTLSLAAAKAGMDEKTARKYRRRAQVPSQLKTDHTWRTRADPFAEVWDDLKELLVLNPGLEAKTLFDHLQREYPGRFQDGQLRTLQRRVKRWRALHGPAKEVFFPQQHQPGVLGQSDFTSMRPLAITIRGQAFNHLVFHFVLTYSNWETTTVCFSESFESLSEGLQNALWELGSVPEVHQTDCMSAAVNKLEHPEDFTDRYNALLRHYRLTGRRSNPASPHENGDVEQRHHRFRKAVDQSLMLRGHRDFDSRAAYEAHLRKLLQQLNAGRQDHLAEEMAVMKKLPDHRSESCQRLWVRVSRFSTIRVRGNTYSVHSRLIGETVEVRLHAEHLDVYYAQRRLERLPRLPGKGAHKIEYRHIIDWLVRKPGAFAEYRFRDDLFPTTRFRLAYDALCDSHAQLEASRQYLQILFLAAYESEARVDLVLDEVLHDDVPISSKRVEAQLRTVDAAATSPHVLSISVPAVDLTAYDGLLSFRQRTEEVSA